MQAKRVTMRDALTAQRLLPGLLGLLGLMACARANAEFGVEGEPGSPLRLVAMQAPAQPSDLHGALAVSSNYRYYAAILYGTGSAARQSALAFCRETEPDAQCAIYLNFKNQCIAVTSNGPHHFVARGKEDWDMQQTRDYGLRLCQEKTGSACKLLISACSTQAQKAEDQRARAGMQAAAAR